MSEEKYKQMLLKVKSGTRTMYFVLFCYLWTFNILREDNALLPVMVKRSQTGNRVIFRMYLSQSGACILVVVVVSCMFFHRTLCCNAIHTGC